jgi:hypothetical protein
VTKIRLDFGGIHQGTWWEYAIRFIAGGAITALVGVIGRKFGPDIGGLFLAFPAIFPASATLVEKHQLQKKRQAGMNGAARSREVAGVDAAGACLGSIGLFAFAVVVYKLLLSEPAWQVLLAALLAWMAVCFLVWWIRKAI